jgi:hypothetical protein
MVAGLRLVLCHLVLWLVARRDSLLVLPGSAASSDGLNQSLALVLTKHSSSDKDSKAQQHSVISINQSNELSTSNGQQDACNNFMI